MTALVGRPSGQPTRRPAGAKALIFGLVRSMRPRQWLKNVLVASAPFFAGRLPEVRVLTDVGLAFVVFCLIASGVYLINDVRDVEFDRAHPTKRNRPIAAGIVPVRVAVVFGVALMGAGLAVAAFASTSGLLIDVAGYAAISMAYCFFLKDQPVIDLAVIASGFLLRTAAGGLATGIPLSQWFLLVASFGALFVAAGKRFSEFVAVGEQAASTRRSLAAYSASYLRFLWGTAAAVTIIAYSLWAVEVNRRAGGGSWALISVAPFVLGLLRYAVDIDNARAGTPEDIAYNDRVLQGLGVLWLVFIVIGITT